jgi:ribosomal protein S21
MIEVNRKDRESPESLIRRFSRRIQQSGVLVRARKVRFRSEGKSKTEMRQGAMYKVKVRKVVNHLKKIGKFDEQNFKNTKKKLIK